jgi:hypothetical protein
MQPGPPGTEARLAPERYRWSPGDRGRARGGLVPRGPRASCGWVWSPGDHSSSRENGPRGIGAPRVQPGPRGTEAPGGLRALSRWYGPLGTTAPLRRMVPRGPRSAPPEECIGGPRGTGPALLPRSPGDRSGGPAQRWVVIGCGFRPAQFRMIGWTGRRAGGPLEGEQRGVRPRPGNTVRRRWEHLRPDRSGGRSLAAWGDSTGFPRGGQPPGDAAPLPAVMRPPTRIDGRLVAPSRAMGGAFWCEEVHASGRYCVLI